MGDRGIPETWRHMDGYSSHTCTSVNADGDYPAWTLKMQIMPFEKAGTSRFNSFDLTKLRPNSDYPLIELRGG